MRAEVERAERGVGLMLDHGAQFERRLADAEPVAELEPEPAGDRCLDECAMGAVIVRERGG